MLVTDLMPSRIFFLYKNVEKILHSSVEIGGAEAEKQKIDTTKKSLIYILSSGSE